MEVSKMFLGECLSEWRSAYVGYSKAFGFPGSPTKNELQMRNLLGIPEGTILTVKCDGYNTMKDVRIGDTLKLFHEGKLLNVGVRESIGLGDCDRCALRPEDGSTCHYDRYCESTAFQSSRYFEAIEEEPKNESRI